MGRNNKYQSTIGQNHSRRLGGIITAVACVPIILQLCLQKVKALLQTPDFAWKFVWTVPTNYAK